MAACPSRTVWDWKRLHLVALREAGRVLGAEDAKDAAQEALLRAWRNADACAASTPDAWVRTIARREALRILTPRSDQRLVAVAEGDEARLDLDDPERRLELITAVRQLSLAERELLYLRYWAGKSDRQIAALLRIPLGTIKVRIHRAQKKLARTLEP